MEGTHEVGRRPFKPQTVLLSRRPPVGSEWIWREPFWSASAGLERQASLHAEVFT
jgi:hypothetical protein